MSMADRDSFIGHDRAQSAWRDAVVATRPLHGTASFPLTELFAGFRPLVS
jgi:hypothetical protein